MFFGESETTFKFNTFSSCCVEFWFMYQILSGGGGVCGRKMCEGTAARILFNMNLPTYADGNKGSGERNSFLCAPVAEKNGTCSANTKSRCWGQHHLGQRLPSVSHCKNGIRQFFTIWNTSVVNIKTHIFILQHMNCEWRIIMPVEWA